MTLSMSEIHAIVHGDGLCPRALVRWPAEFFLRLNLASQVFYEWLPMNTSYGNTPVFKPASKGDLPTMPKQAWSEKTEKELVLATFPQVAPFSFKDSNNAIIGYDIELAGYLAQKLGARLVIKEMPFEQMIPAVANGTVDIAAACITVAQERAAVIKFSEAYYCGGIAAMVIK